MELKELILWTTISFVSMAGASVLLLAPSSFTVATLNVFLVIGWCSVGLKLLSDGTLINRFWPEN